MYGTLHEDNHIDVFSSIIERASVSKRRIVLSEGEDDRIQAAAVRAAKEGLATPVLVGDEAIIRRGLERFDTAQGIEVVDPRTSTLAMAFADAYLVLRRHKGVDEVAAARAVLDPLVFAALMVRQGEGDGTVGGAVHTTGDTVRVAFQVIGVAEGVERASSFMLMFLDASVREQCGVVVFADCALIVQPDARQLAQIVVSSADSLSSLLDETPRVALLSFSTLGSASHERVDLVAEATRLAKSARPELDIVGELQFDAAFVPAVAARKAPGSAVAGKANVFVFPSLEAGNIGYKIAQRIGGARAVGPVLQGLAKPANDLSRGCDVVDVHALIAVTAMQANGQLRA